MKKIFLAIACLLSLFFIQPARTVPTIQLTSTDFNNGQRMPIICTGEGQNLSPQLSWQGIPISAKSIAIICDDPDAKSVAGKVWDHWVIFNIPPTVNHLNRGVAINATLPDGTRQGKNSSNAIGYAGPYPPKGHSVHHYYFKIYALNKKLVLPAGTTTKNDLLKAMKKHIMAQGELMGTYSRE